ncbi:MAG: hypothetical protein AAFV90_08670 [Cyanobacteria bacterium J06634_5]
MANYKAVKGKAEKIVEDEKLPSVKSPSPLESVKGEGLFGFVLGATGLDCLHFSGR